MNQLPTFFTNVQERRVCRWKNRKLTFLFKHAEIGEHIGHQHYNLFRQYFHQSLLSKDPFSQACVENEPRNRNACTCYDVYWSIAFNWFFFVYKSALVFTNHFLERSLPYPSCFPISRSISSFECNTTSDWLNHRV